MKKIFLIYAIIGLVFTNVKAQTPDPFIQSIISQTNLDSLTKYVNELTGEVSTVVNGNTVTILNRVSNSGNDIAAEYLIQKLESYGLSVTNQQYSTNGRNVFAEQVGTTYPDEKYIICAHYDAVANYCADDNASGCAAVVEAARLLSQHDFPYTIVYAFWDEEEIGLIGSGYYASQAASNGDVINGVLNLEMFGWDSNDDGLYDIHTDDIANSVELSQILVDVNSTYNLDVTPGVYNPGTTGSDHSSFWDEGYTAIVFSQAFFGGDSNPYYHTSSDRISEFNMPYFHEMSKLALATFTKLAMGDQLPAPIAEFIPENGTVDVEVDTEILVSFNTPMRKLDDSEISDPSEFITVKLDDVSGNDVTFTASINADKTEFAIIPDQELEHNQLYYVEISNQIENEQDAQFDGAFMSFTTINNEGIASIEPDDARIYPNPAQDVINIEFAKTIDESFVIEIFDLSGKRVMFKSFNNIESASIDVSKLNAGMYMLNIRNEHFSFMKKVTIS